MNLDITIVDISQLTPLEKVFPGHLRNLKDMIHERGAMTTPIIADKNTGTILDGSHRYAFLVMEGYQSAPVVWVNYNDNHIRVGSHLMHRHIINETPNINKAEVLTHAKNGNLYPPRTTRHFFPFRKIVDANIPLNTLKKGPSQDISHLLDDVKIEDEIAHNEGYLKEIEMEIEEIGRYLIEITHTKVYLNAQLKEMKAQ